MSPRPCPSALGTHACHLRSQGLLCSAGEPLLQNPSHPDSHAGCPAQAPGLQPSEPPCLVGDPLNNVTAGGIGVGKEAGRADRPLNALWGSEAGLGPAMLAAQAVDTGATALPASPTRSCRLHLPRPGTQRPLGDGDEGLWIWPGLGTLACRGRLLVPSAHAEALDMEGGSKKKGPAAHLQGFPGVPRSPDLRAPVGRLSGCTSPQSSQLQPNFSDGETETQTGGGPERSCSAPEASLGPNPPAPPCLCQELQLELSWESARKRKGSCPLGRRGIGSGPGKQLT